MAREGQEESTSSQNVNKYILNISERGTSVEITVSDSSSFFIFNEDFCSVDISSGDPVDSRLFELLVLFDERYRACRKSLDLLSISAQTRYMLKIKLLKRGFSEESVNYAVEYLEKKNLINDRDYAERWVESRLKKNPEGPFRLKVMLTGKGVERAVADDVVNALLDDQAVETAVKKIIEKLEKRSGMTGEKIMRKLLSKGFSPAVIKKYLIL